MSDDIAVRRLKERISELECKVYDERVRYENCYSNWQATRDQYRKYAHELKVLKEKMPPNEPEEITDIEMKHV